jgi:hypothetical protein
MTVSMFASNQELLGALSKLATAARHALEALTPQQRAYIFSEFPRGACGPTTELMGRIVLEETGHRGIYVCGAGHPELRAQQSHAWLEVGGYIVDLTHDQFPGTGLDGWVFEHTRWHAAFEREITQLCLQPSQWGQYPYAAYSALHGACSLMK